MQQTHHFQGQLGKSVVKNIKEQYHRRANTAQVQIIHEVECRTSEESCFEVDIDKPGQEPDNSQAEQVPAEYIRPGWS